jgi:uncharacterized protein
VNDRSDLVRAAVITGGHSYDVINFRRLFRELEGIDAYVQHIDDFSTSPEEVRDAYDAVAFYTFLQEEPRDEDVPWYVGQPKTALAHLGATEQGIVVLHHALLAYPGWSLWDDMVGIEERGFGFHPEQTLEIEIANPDHPITRNLAPFSLVDETYTMDDAGEGSEILLTTSHPNSMRTIAWTRRYRNARVFCFESGHDNQAWSNPGFRQVLARGIRWAANTL